MRTVGGAVLTIEPGMVIKVLNDFAIYNAGLRALGAPGQEIVFTSLKDDSEHLLNSSNRGSSGREQYPKVRVLSVNITL